MPNDDTVDTREFHPEESDKTLRREFAKFALMGIMGEATKERMSEEDIARRCWRAADAMLDLEEEPEEAPPPPQPQRGGQRNVSQGRPVPRRINGR